MKVQALPVIQRIPFMRLFINSRCFFFTHSCSKKKIRNSPLCSIPSICANQSMSLFSLCHLGSLPSIFFSTLTSHLYCQFHLDFMRFSRLLNCALILLGGIVEGKEVTVVYGILSTIIIIQSCKTRAKNFGAIVCSWSAIHTFIHCITVANVCTNSALKE